MTHENARPGRLRLLGLLAFVFIAAQLLYAAHLGAAPDPLLDHSSSTCDYCLAGAAVDDPTLLVAVLTAPTPVFLQAVLPAETAADIQPLRLAADPRAPPSC
jgi:hypothetical protein